MPPSVQCLPEWNQSRSFGLDIPWFSKCSKHPGPYIFGPENRDPCSEYPQLYSTTPSKHLQTSSIKNDGLLEIILDIPPATPKEIMEVKPKTTHCFNCPSALSRRPHSKCSVWAHCSHRDRNSKRWGSVCHHLRMAHPYCGENKRETSFVCSTPLPAPYSN